jgi:hypothetical protein
MPVTKFRLMEESHPAPSSELPKSYTYIQLGCEACEHGVGYKVSGNERTEEIEAAVSHISPRRITHRGLTRAVSSVCPKDSSQCTVGDQIDAVANLLDKAYNKE